MPAGSLRVTGTMSVEQYMFLLRTSLAFSTAEQQPRTDVRSLQLRVTDERGATSAVHARETAGGTEDGFVEVARVSVVSVNDATVLGGVPRTARFFTGRGAAGRLALLANATLADRDNATLVSVAVSLEGPGFEAGRDRLVSTGAAAGMEVVDAAADGSRLLLRAGTGAGSFEFGTLAQFQSTLRGVRFDSVLPTGDGMRVVRVVAFDGASTTTALTNATVVRAVRFTVPPVAPSSALQPGTAFALAPQVAGTPPIAFRWDRFNWNASASGGTAPVLFSPSLDRWKLKLDFGVVLFEDAADVYRLTASNEAGDAMGGELAIVVSQTAPTWYTEVSGRQLITPTVVAQTDKLIMIQWEEPAWNGIKPHPAEPYRLQFREGAGAWQDADDTLPGEATLELLYDVKTKMSTSAETYSFRVFATNDCGVHASECPPGATSLSSGVLVGVTPNPRQPIFTENLDATPVALDPGATLTLKVNATGTPVPTYQWFRNGVQLPGQTNATLAIASLSKAADDGTYMCETSNYLRTVQSIKVPLAINTLPTVQTFSRVPAGKVLAGTSVLLQCKASGVPAPTFTWLRNGTAYGKGEKSGSTWRLVAEADDETKDPWDTYVCIATNSVGGAQSPPLTVDLQSCDPGTRRDEKGYCLDCPIGQFMASNAHRELACKACSVGKRAGAVGAAACDDCERGQHQADQGQARCLACPAGKFTSSRGLANCLSCDPGKFGATAEAITCADCITGKFMPGSGATECALCPAGRVDGGTNKKACTECAAGQYKMALGDGACALCEDKMESNRLRTTCICKHGTYFTASNGSAIGKACHDCRPGMLCNGTDVAFLSVNSERGFWQVKEWITGAKRSAFSMRKCPVLSEQICLGGHDRLHGGLTCRAGHTGPLCTTCEEGFQLGAGDLCASCAQPVSLSMVLLYTGIAAFVLAGSMSYFIHRHRDQLHHWCDRQFDRFLRHLGLRHKTDGDGKLVSCLVVYGLAMKFKILLGLFQVSTGFVKNFEINWPTLFVGFTMSFSLFNLDLPNMGCLVSVNFVDKFLSAIFTPLVVVVPLAITFILFSVAHAATGDGRRDPATGKLYQLLHIRNLSMKWILYLLFIVYPSTCQAILKIFACTTLENGRSYLTADMSIECADVPVTTQIFGDALTYTRYRELALIALAVYPIGVPVFFFLVLYVAHNHKGGLYVGDSHVPEPELGEELGFLYAGYDKDYW